MFNRSKLESLGDVSITRIGDTTVFHRVNINVCKIVSSYQLLHSSYFYMPKVDIKRKFLFSQMKVHEKQERTLLTAF